MKIFLLYTLCQGVVKSVILICKPDKPNIQIPCCIFRLSAFRVDRHGTRRRGIGWEVNGGLPLCCSNFCDRLLSAAIRQNQYITGLCGGCVNFGQANLKTVPLHYSRKRQKSPDKIGKRIGWLSRSAFACLSLQQTRLFLLEFFGSD